MKCVESGKYFEEIAKNKFKKEGYCIIEHSSKKNYLSDYDFVVSKDNKILFIDVKGNQYNYSFFI
jgi:hypothetical protein